MNERTPLTAGLAGWRLQPAVRVDAHEAEAEVEVRMDMYSDGLLVIGPECVLRGYEDVHPAPSYAAPPPRAAASFNHALQRTRHERRGCNLRSRAPGR